MYVSLPSKIIKKISVLYLFLGMAIPGVFAQQTDISGDWEMRINNGAKNNVRIDQTGNKLIFWIKIGSEVRPFTGEMTGEEFSISSPVRNSWPESKRACHNNITALAAQYPQYQVVLNLRVNGKKLEGAYQYPKNISCKDGNIDITLSEPLSVAFIRVNYIYRISGKKIYKSPVNRPENESLITEGDTDNMIGLTLDKNGKRLYWAEGKYIYSIQQNGKGKQLVSTAPEAVFNPHSLVVDDKKNRLIWVEGYKIISTLLGRDARTTLVEEQNSPRSVVVDSVNGKLYWLLNHSDKIRQANADGSNARDLATDPDAAYLAIDAAEGYLYWTTHNAIKRASISAPQQVETLLSGRSLPRDIIIDKKYNRIYWTENNHIWKANTNGTRAEQLLRSYNMGAIATGPKGPARYEEVKIDGSLLIKSAVAGKSLLQELARNDTYYQVLLSEYERSASDYNLTDARLVLIWGKNFPGRQYKGNNIVFSSSDLAINYQEFDIWTYKLGDTQKEKYSNYPQWLALNSGILKKTWDMAWGKLKDSLGAAQLNAIKAKDHMLVLAVPGKGVLPGMKSFSMNDAEAQWYLNAGTAKAGMRFLRRLENGEEETITSLYAGDPFFIEIETDRAIERNSIKLSYFINNSPLQSDGVQLEAVKHGNTTTYRTPAISLQEFSEDGGRLYPGVRGNAESSCKTGSVFKAMVSDVALFNNGNPPVAAAQLVNPVNSVWHQALGEAVLLTDGLSIPESEWESAANKTVKTFSSMDITEIPNGSATSSCDVSLGDYAAMLLLKKYFVRQMKTYYSSLEKHKNDEVFQYGFWEMMAPHMQNENFPPGNIEVDNGRALLRNAFSKDYILDKYRSPRTAAQWIKKVKKEGFTKYLNSIKKSLNDAENLDDKDIEKLMNLTGFGFNAMVNLVRSDLQKKKFSTTSDTACDVIPHLWEPDNTGRAYVKTMSITAEHCRANEELQAAGTDVLLAAASLVAFPLAAYSTYGRLAAAVYSAALGSGELIRDNIKFNAEDTELAFAGGSFAVLGTERYAMARLKVTPTWARMLSYFGGGLGVAGDAFDILKFAGKADMASVYARLPSLLNDMDQKGALEAYRAMSPNNKARFLLMLGEAENLKKLPADELTGAQRKIISAAEQFAGELDTAARSGNALTEAGDAAKNLSEGLPANPRDEVPVIKDDALPGSTVHLEYELDADGFLTQIKVRAGKTAKAQHIAAHVPALTEMKKYEQAAGTAANLYRRIKHWYARVFKGDPPPGTPAWEAMQEVRKLNYIIEGRINGLISKTGAIDPQRITKEIQDLSAQLNKHQRAFEEFVTNPGLARGFIAATDNITTDEISKSVRELAGKTLKSNSNILSARAQRIRKALDFLNRSPQRKELYDAVIAQATRKGDPEVAARFLDRLGHLETLSSEQLAGMRAFMKATGDVESLTLILQRGIPRQRAFTNYSKNTMNTVLKLLHHAKDSPETLAGVAACFSIMGKRSVASVDKLRMLADKLEVKNYGSVFETVKEFEDFENFRKILNSLSSDNPSAFIGAMGQLAAARKFAKEFGKEAIVFESRFNKPGGAIFRDVDILVRKDGKILKLVECKEYARLAGLFEVKIKRQFAKDLVLAYRNGLTPSTGMVWMISKTVLKQGNETVQMKRLAGQFLKVFSDQRFKSIICEIDANTLKAFKKEIEDNPKLIFQFF